MFTSKFNKTEETPQGKRFYVDFVDDVTGKVITEHCIPQDEEGFNFWIKGRLTTHNSSEVIEGRLVKGEEIQTEKEPEVAPQPTVKQLAQSAYLAARYNLIDLKQDLDLGLITKTEYDAEVVKVKAKKPAKV